MNNCSIKAREHAEEIRILGVIRVSHYIECPGLSLPIS